MAIWLGHRTSRARGKASDLELCNPQFVILHKFVAWRDQRDIRHLTLDAECTQQDLQKTHFHLSWSKTLDRLERTGSYAHLATYASLLREVGYAKDLSDGRLVHAHILKSRHGQSSFLKSLLVQMYGQCGAVEDARALFSQIGTKNVYSWNIMIGIDVQQGSGKEALQLFQQMQAEGKVPDKFTFVSSLTACTSHAALSLGKQMHAHFAGSEFETDVVVGTAIINMYSKCGCLEDAQTMFEKIPERDPAAWNAMIGAYVHQGKTEKALQLFSHMQHEGLIPNKVTFLNIINACASHTTLAIGLQMHTHVGLTEFEFDVVTATALIGMYGKCGSMESAQTMFDKMHVRNVVSWNAMIATYAQHDRGKKALQLFSQMQQEAVVPDKVTFCVTLSACSSQSFIVRGKYLHTCISYSGFESDIGVTTALVSMYGKCGCLEYALWLFDKMPRKDVVSWNVMISVLIQNGHSKEALKLFDKMQQADVVPDKVTFISCLSAYADVSMEGAREMFHDFPEKEVSVWNAMIAAYVQHGNCREALILFEQMQWERVRPDKVTFLVILSACASQAALTEGKRMHIHMILNGYASDLVLATAAINMYAKCGNLEEAFCVFEYMHERDVVSWNAMISACSQHGDGKMVIHLCNQMQQDGVFPCKITFVSILEACASEGLLAKGKHIHACIMQGEFMLDIFVVTALVNMYHKCGRLDEAHHVFDKISEHDAVSWSAIITAYSQQGQGMEALQLFNQMQREGVIPDRVVFVNILSACASQAALMNGMMIHTCITNIGVDLDATVANSLVNMYSKCGRMQEARRVFDRMPKRDILSFNIMIAGYAQHGHSKESFQLFDEMQQGGLTPDTVSFASIISACSHSGLVDEGHHCLTFMKKNHCITLTGEHYDCMLDLLGRAGQLDEAEILINGMPIQPTSVSWMTLLGACRKQMDVERGEHIARHMFEMHPKNYSPYVMLSNIYAAAGRGDDAERIISIMRGICFSKQVPGESKASVHQITSDDQLCILEERLDEVQELVYR